jgi:hypothetical protein
LALVPAASTLVTTGGIWLPLRPCLKGLGLFTVLLAMKVLSQGFFSRFFWSNDEINEGLRCDVKGNEFFDYEALLVFVVVLSESLY